MLTTKKRVRSWNQYRVLLFSATLNPQGGSNWRAARRIEWRRLLMKGEIEELLTVWSGQLEDKTISQPSDQWCGNLYSPSLSFSRLLVALVMWSIMQHVSLKAKHWIEATQRVVPTLLRLIIAIKDPMHENCCGTRSHSSRVIV